MSLEERALQFEVLSRLWKETEEDADDSDFDEDDE